MDNKFLEKWSKSTGKSIKELEKIYEQVEQEVEKVYTEISSAERDRVTKQLFGKQARQMMFSKTKAESFFGFILGASRKNDIAEFMRRKALKAYRENPMEAQITGTVDENGVPLDAREKIGNRDNPNFHKPLTGHIWNRRIYGMAIKEGTKQPMLFVMTLWRATADKFSYKPFVPIEFKALLKNMKNGFYELNVSKLTKFQATRRTIDFEKWIRDVANQIVPLSELRKEATKNQGSYDNYVFTEGDVDLINLQVNPNTNSRSIILSDAESGMIETVRVFLPADFPIGFSELSRVIVLGRPRLWRREGATKDSVSMEGFSVFPLPGQTVNMDLPEGEEVDLSAPEDEGPIIEFIEEPEK